jgi:ferredoxin--NADP+ reductase
MAKYATETVTDVKHWNDTLFSFKTTRDDGLRFRNGEFIMIGLEAEPRPLMRAYSIASANYDDYLEFYSIKAPNGALTSRLQHLKVGDDVLIGSKPTGTLVPDDVKDGKNLFLFATGTGLAPFLSIIKDPEVYERFDKIILFHGVRFLSELGYYDWLSEGLKKHEYLGEMIDSKLCYYPAVTREPFRNQGRLTDLVASGKLCKDLNLPQLNPHTDRAMVCGSPAMLKDICEMLDGLGFAISPKIGIQGDYVIERSFVER